MKNYSISLKNNTSRFARFTTIAFCLFVFSFTTFGIELSIGDVVKIATQRENQLSGYGLVVGLPQTGDSRSPLAKEALARLLEYHGIYSNDEKFQGKNIAVVMVTATLTPNVRSGDYLDVWVSSIGDAKSLEGGFLLQTPLKAGDNQVYAVAQAYLQKNNEERASQRRNKKNTVRIIKGALVEKTLAQPITDGQNRILLTMRQYDIQNAGAIINVINEKFPNAASLDDSGIIAVQVPTDKAATIFLAGILDIRVNMKALNRVVIDRESGTIVMGQNVKISTVGVTKNGISIKITNNSENSSDDREERSSVVLEEAATVEDLVTALNSLGLNTRDIIDILEAIHAAGALHAELVVL
ncbi:MAG: flagellar basal body P-ring protein FlgI [Leptospirales bacterium]